MTPSDDAAGPRLRRRSDAERNRARIVETARRLHRETGPDVPLDVIATEAGVGNATVYRHFANRAALRTAVLSERLREVEDFLHGMAEDEDAWAALERYTRFLASIPDNTLVEVLVTPPEDTPDVQAEREGIRPMVEALLERAKRAGRLRDDYTLEDMNVFLFAHARAASSPRIDSAAADRLLEHHLAGIATPAP
jgi:AcrR family transcriptional regulator